LRLDVSDESVLHEVYALHLLNHHHELRGITTAQERTHRDVDDLTKHVVKDTEGSLLNIVKNQIPLIFGTSGGISNPRSQGGTKEAVKIVELWQEVLSLRGISNCLESIHEEHLLLQDPVRVDVSFHGVLVLQPKQSSNMHSGGPIFR
jgi:hypothetical protein